MKLNDQFRLIALLFLCNFLSVSAQVSKIGYSEKDDATLLFYKVKDIDTVKIPGNWEIDKRDLATAMYLQNANSSIGFYIDTKKKKYVSAANDADALKLYADDKIRKIKKSWEVELLETDGASYQLYKIKSLRHPDGGQLALLGSRGKYVYNIVCYGAIDDSIKSELLIRLFKKTTP